MSRERLTGKFNATNVVFDVEHAPDVENNLNPMDKDKAYSADVPAQQIDDTIAVKPPVVPVIIEDVPIYTPSEERLPLTAPEKDETVSVNAAQNKKLEEIDLNAAQKEQGAVKVGRIEVNNNLNTELTQEQRDKKAREYNSLLERLLEHQRWLRGMMDRIQNVIDGLTLEIEEHGRIIDALELFKEDFEDNGLIALDDEGYPQSAKAKAALKEWENKTGKKWDPNAKNAMDVIDLIILDQINQRQTKYDQRDGEQQKWNQFNSDWKATDDAIKVAQGVGYTTATNETLDDFSNFLSGQSDKYAQEMKPENTTENNLADNNSNLNQTVSAGFIPTNSG